MATRAVDCSRRHVFHRRPDKRQRCPERGPANQYPLRGHAVGSSFQTMVDQTGMVAWVDDTHRRKFPDRRGGASIPLVQSLTERGSSPGRSTHGTSVLVTNRCPSLVRFIVDPAVGSLGTKVQWRRCFGGCRLSRASHWICGLRTGLQQASPLPMAQTCRRRVPPNLTLPVQ